MSGRYLSPKDTSAARYEQEVINSLRRRGEVRDAEKIIRERHIVCGCGAEGCIFINLQRDESKGTDKVK